jgi:hypothetical protein
MQQLIMRILILIILFTGTLKAVAQTSMYHPFPDSNAVWNIQYYDPVSCGSCSNQHYEWFSYVFDQDTLINSTSYHKLTIPYVGASDGRCCVNYSTGYSGAIRQDIAARKVYFITPGNASEQLLYDFNLQIGDSVKNAPLNCIGIVMDIDSILVGNNYRKRWKVGPTFPSYIIEGVGSSLGLISAYCNSQWWNVLTLSCFGQDGRKLLFDSNGSCSPLLVNSAANNRIKIALYPNPFHSTTSLSSNITKGELKIFNIYGQVVRWQEIDNKFTVLQRDELRDGIYLYELIGDNKETARGIFVIN